MDKKKRLSAHDIAETLIADIRAGRYVAGDRLREQDLAERFDTSRGPVREGLKLLVSQFWVVHEAGKGARVIEISPRSHPDAMVIGRAINGAMIQFIVARATPTDFDRLDGFVREMADAVKAGILPEALSELEWKLGRFLVTIAKSPMLEETCRPLQTGAVTQYNLVSKRTHEMRVEVVNLWIDLAISLRHGNAVAALRNIEAVVDYSVRAESRMDYYPHLLD